MRMQQQDEVIDSAESFVDDVESTLAQREQEAVEAAREAAANDTTDDQDTLCFFTPPIQGGEIDDTGYSEHVVFHFTSELPNGQEKLSLPLPESDQIDDEAHPLNRLLDMYDVTPATISDLTGARLPIEPRGDYSDPQSVTYQLDIPPVPTRPNMLLYRTTRAAKRLGLIRWGHTPKLKRDILGEVESAKLVGTRTAPAMPASAYGFFRLFQESKENQETFVLTHRGVAAGLSAMIGVMLALVPLAATLSPILGLLTVVGQFFLLLMTLYVGGYAAMDWGQKLVNWTKNRFFPSP